MAKVTFIMPAYNAGRYIEEAIRSLQAQTVSDWKLIVMDDGSIDDTYSIVSRLASEDPRICLQSMPQASGGAYQPRRRAILMADTEFVAPLDADDSVEPEYLEKLLKAISEMDADIAYPVMVTENGPMADYRDFEGKVFEGRDCVKYTLEGWKINCNGGVIRKSIYEEAYKRYGGDLDYSYADELLTRQLLILAPKVVFVNATYHYRYNPDSITHNISKRAFDFLKCHISLKTLIEDNFGKGTEEYKSVNRQLFYDYFVAMNLITTKGIDAEVKVYALQEMKKCKHEIDKDATKKGVSRKLSFLFPFPVSVAKRLLKYTGIFRP